VPPSKIPPLATIPGEERALCKIIDEKITRDKGQDICLYLARFKDLLSDCERWLKKEEIPEADKLIRTFQASVRGKKGSGVRAILFSGGASVSRLVLLRSNYPANK
jgi:hypothetical protein